LACDLFGTVLDYPRKITNRKAATILEETATQLEDPTSQMRKAVFNPVGRLEKRDGAVDWFSFESVKFKPCGK
jgi:hypothetical protein